METIQTAVFSYDELSTFAQEKARDWYRMGACVLDEYDCVFEDAADAAAIFGLDIRTRAGKRMNGGAHYAPAIFFSGFSSQGDGACFEGNYFYRKGALAAVKAYAPEDTELHRIVAELQNIQRKAFYKLSARTTHHGRYYHSGCMNVSVGVDADRYPTDTEEESLAECMRDFADWIYKQLEAEHDYQNSDEQVAEAIRSNEYTFTEDGARFG